MGDAYSENEALCEEQDAAQRSQGRKTRHRIKAKRVLGEAPLWVKKGHAVRVRGYESHAVQVLAISSKASEGNHPAARLVLVPLTGAAET